MDFYMRLYADDSVSLVLDTNELDDWWEKLELWLNKFGLELNMGPNKTTAIVVKGEVFKDWCAAKGITVVKEYKYLGVWIRGGSKGYLIGKKLGDKTYKARADKIKRLLNLAVWKLKKGKYRWSVIRAYLLAINNGFLYGVECPLVKNVPKKYLQCLDSLMSKELKNTFMSLEAPAGNRSEDYCCFLSWSCLRSSTKLDFIRGWFG